MFVQEPISVYNLRTEKVLAAIQSIFSLHDIGRTRFICDVKSSTKTQLHKTQTRPETPLTNTY